MTTANVIRFPHVAANEHTPGVRHHHHPAPTFLDDPPEQSHVVQFYRDDDFLLDAVSRFLAAGLQAGDAVVAIATEAHREALVRRLERLGGRGALRTGQLSLLDARESLSAFMVGDAPDGDRFRDFLARTLPKIEGAHASARIRVFGETVDILSRDGNHRAAIRLEGLWSAAANDHGLSLLCACVMGNFRREGDAEQFREVCRHHGHVLPAETFASVEDPDARLHEICLLQQRAHALAHEVEERRAREHALSLALSERVRVEEELRAALERERGARADAETNVKFAETMVAILGHDLRNPLNTILMSARLMLMERKGRRDEATRRIDRMVGSGVRMQRMIDQLLDMTRARLCGGIPIARQPSSDLSIVVSKIVDEARAANHGREIALRAKRVLASVDADRFEQVVSNLVGNAVTHGDPRRPVVVDIAEVEGEVRLVVQNFGPPIDLALLPDLFEPFVQRGKTRGPSAALGLGLFVSERIVHAHGGRIVVSSSLEAGTRFEVFFPT